MQMPDNLTPEEVQFYLKDLAVAHQTIADLTTLAEGCKKHPAYRAHRRPTVEDCDCCNKIFAAKHRLRQAQQALATDPAAKTRLQRLGIQQA